MRQLLRESPSFRRVVGFADAVDDLGTHRICGTDATYSRQMVYNVLYGRSLSKKLIARIVERRPDMLELSFVADATKMIAQEMGWRPKNRALPDAAQNRENRALPDAAQDRAVTEEAQDRGNRALPDAAQNRENRAVPGSAQDRAKNGSGQEEYDEHRL